MLFKARKSRRDDKSPPDHRGLLITAQADGMLRGAERCRGLPQRDEGGAVRRRVSRHAEGEEQAWRRSRLSRSRTCSPPVGHGAVGSEREEELRGAGQVATKAVSGERWTAAVLVWPSAKREDGVKQLTLLHMLWKRASRGVALMVRDGAGS